MLNSKSSENYILENRKNIIEGYSLQPEEFLFRVRTSATKIIRTIGVPAHLKGYNFLREAIIKTVINPELVYAVTKELYPSVAKEFKTTPPRVERAIRHAVELMWEQGDREELAVYFSYRLSRNFDRPTNSEVIANISDSIRQELQLF